MDLMSLKSHGKAYKAFGQLMLHVGGILRQLDYPKQLAGYRTMGLN